MPRRRRDRAGDARYNSARNAGNSVGRSTRHGADVRRAVAEIQMTDSFGSRATLDVSGRTYRVSSLAALPQEKVATLPYSLKVLLENLLRFEDGVNVRRAD